MVLLRGIDLSQSRNRKDMRDLMKLGKLERLIMEYFLRHISAGEIIAIIDLREEVKKRVRSGETDLVSELDDAVIEKELHVKLALLVMEGYLESRNGVYRLAQWIIDALRAKKHRLMPGVPKNIEELLD